MTIEFLSISDASGGLNLRASDRAIRENESQDLDNVEFTKSGAVTKSNGYVVMNAIPIPGQVTGIYEFIRSDGSRIVLVTGSTKIYTMDTGSGVLTEIYDGITADTAVDFATFNDYCIIVNGEDAPLKYDGTTVTALAEWTNIEALGNPSFVEVWKNRLWFTGNPLKPFRVYHSEPGNPEGWNTASGAGAMDVNINDGQQVTGIRAYFDSLLVYKTRSVQQLVGDSAVGSGGSNEFRFKPASTDIGCVAPGSIITVGNDQYFMDIDNISTVRTTNAFGDVQTLPISFKIQPIFESVNRSAMSGAFVIHHRLKSQILFYLPNGSSSQNNTVLIYDYALLDPDTRVGAWTQKSGFTASCGTLIDGLPITGTYDGYIHKHDFGGSYDGGQINAHYNTPWYQMKNPAMTKRMRSVDITLASQGNWNLTVYTGWDYKGLERPFHINQEPLGVAALWGSAVWGVSTWSTDESKVKRLMGDLGNGKAFAMQFFNSGADQPFLVFGWDMAYRTLGMRPGGG